MSRDASITLDWADGTYVFRLAWAQLAELQEKCDAGPFVILDRLGNGAWKIEDISNVIRLGLIGGGIDPAKALKLTRAYVEARPPLENLVYAQGVLSVAVMGAPDEDSVKKNERPETENGSTASPAESFE